MRLLLAALLVFAGCGAGDPREEAASHCRGHYDQLWRWITARGEAPATPEELREAAGLEGVVDPWGHPYAVEKTPTAYRVWSNGPDGEPDTEDDIVYPP